MQLQELGYLMLHWYVARVQSRKENVAQTYLADQGIDAFLPRFRATLRCTNAFEVKLGPLFPGYIFCRSSYDPALWRSVGRTRGVSYVLWSDGQRPNPVPDEFMSMLFSLCNAGVLDRTTDHIRLGMCVRVNHGPFAGMPAVVAKLSDAGRVSILFNIMGGANVRTNIANVEQLSREGAPATPN